MVTLKYTKPADFPKDIERYLTELDTSRFTEHDFKMLEVKKRDKFKCYFCSLQTLNTTVHHKFPKRDGGQDSLNNCLTMCRPCHDKLEMLISTSSPMLFGDFIPIILNKISKTIYVWSVWKTKKSTDNTDS